MIRWLLPFLFLSFTPQALASFQNGMGFELNLGYPQMNANVGSSRAIYQGYSMQGQFIIPVLDYGENFSTDMSLGYRYTSYQNNASTSQSAELAQLQGFGIGFRGNFKYFFIGIEMPFLSGRHLVSGTRNQINEYNINPIQGYLGMNWAIGKNTSLAVSYAQHLLKGKATVNAQDVEINEQIVMLTIQLDFGFKLFNHSGGDDGIEYGDNDYLNNLSY